MQKISSITVVPGTPGEEVDLCASVEVTKAAEVAATWLLANLIDIFPVITATMKSEDAAKSWVAHWALQISAAGLKPHELNRGMLSLQHLPQNHTPSWPEFYWLCRPKMADEEVRETYFNAVHWISAKTETLCHMPDELWVAGVHYGLEALRLSQPDHATLAKWRRCLDRARADLDPSILARRPKTPSSGLLPAPQGHGASERLEAARRAALERLRNLGARFGNFASN